MFWIAIELNNPKLGVIIKLSLKMTKLTAFESNGVTKFGNTAHNSSGLQSSLRFRCVKKSITSPSIEKIIPTNRSKKNICSCQECLFYSNRPFKIIRINLARVDLQMPLELFTKVGWEKEWQRS